MNKISVIIPVYNVEAYLPKCIESVICQTYSEIEIILVDDGSTDESGAICDSYALKDKRILVFHKENGGLSDARNYGLAKAQGDYIAFIDGDDYIAPEMLQLLYEKMQTDHSDMAVCSYYFVDEKGNLLVAQNGESPIYDEILFGNDAIHKLEHHKKWYFTVAWNKLYRSCIFRDIKFPQNKCHEDEYVAHHIFHKCKKISFVGKELYFYVQRQGSITNTESLVHKLYFAEAMLERAVFAAEHDLQELIRICLDDLIQIIYCSCGQEKSSDYKKSLNLFQKKCRKVLIRVLNSSIPVSEKLRYCVLCIDINLLNDIHNTLVDRKKRKFSRNIQKQIRNIQVLGKKCIYLFATPEHGNLGDHAIVCAIKQILQDMHLDNFLVEITRSEYEAYKEILIQCVQPEDLILISGGGNLGTLWPEEDNVITDIVNTYKEQNIIVFPQTCYYEDSALADTRRLRNRKIYAGAKNLKVFLRDRISYDLFQRYFSETQAYLMPDMVAYYEQVSSCRGEKVCLFCLRDDKESILSKESGQKLMELICGRGYKIKKYSTVRPYMILPKCRKKEVTKGLKEFAQARLVITDRLHGMLFAAITGTPCICIDNISGKVRGQITWLTDVPYIKFAETVDDITNEFEKFLEQSGNMSYNVEALKPFYEKLKREIVDSYSFVR